MPRRPVTLRPSKARIVLWAICAVISVYLAVELLERAPDKLAGQERMNAAAETGPVGDGVARPGAAPPAVRFGLMPRAAHLIALSGLEMNLYASAALDQGAVEVRVYDRSRGLTAALRAGEVDLACVPIRVAVELYTELGDAAPRIVAGGALDDERYVVRDGLAAFDVLPFAPLRFGVLEAPALDVARALGSGGDEAPTVRLVTESSTARMLASGEIDLAVLPLPLATQVAALSGSSVDDARSVPSRRLLGGAVLVVAPRFAAEHGELLERLVTAHVVSGAFVESDPATAIERAISLLEGIGAEVPPALFWTNGIEGVTFDVEIPTERISEVLSLAGDEPVEALIDDTILAAARAALEEEEDGG